jgi:hypothetical protein
MVNHKQATLLQDILRFTACLVQCVVFVISIKRVSLAHQLRHTNVKQGDRRFHNIPLPLLVVSFLNFLLFGATSLAAVSIGINTTRGLPSDLALLGCESHHFELHEAIVAGTVVVIADSRSFTREVVPSFKGNLYMTWKEKSKVISQSP